MPTGDDTVSRYYNGKGWEVVDGHTDDARSFEDLRPVAAEYVSKCRMRVMRHIPPSGAKLLDMASGPIQYPEYLRFSEAYDERHCVDLSENALDQAREKLGDRGVYWHGNFLQLPIAENTYDCTISLHTIYHIDRSLQEDAVRKLIRVTKRGAPIVVVYSNPWPIFRYLKAPLAVVRNTFRRLRNPNTGKDATFYFHAHPVSWWNRFADQADVRILPWRSFGAGDQRRLLRGPFAKRWFETLFRLEERFPSFFARYFQHPMIVMTKR